MANDKKSQALELWKYEMQDKPYAYDFSGRKVKKTDFEMNNSVGWVVAYMKPLELGGKDYDGNTIIMHHTTRDEKGLNFQEFEIMNKQYRVVYDEKEDFYYIEKISPEDGGFI